MNNKQINKIKKRADTLTDYIINKVDRLELANHELEERSRNTYLMFKKYDMAFDKVVNEIVNVEKADNGDIEVIYKDKDTHSTIANPLIEYYLVGSVLYPLGELILKKWEDRVEFNKLIKEYKKGSKPITLE